MKLNHRISRAVIAVLGAHTAGAHAASADAGTDTISEVTVTAQRRTESAQDVPIALQALTQEMLTELHVSTFDDFVRYLPNVQSAGFGPGQSNVYMRGLATGTGLVPGSGAVGSFPNVAVYLDEQSAQLPGRNLDLYAADLERIEVLEGPQGTLFGAGAQAGVLRYITNKPKLDRTEGAVNAGYAVTAHGAPSTNVDAMINIPIVPDRLAVRGVIYNESRGGYIDNIPGVFARAPTDKVSVNYFGGVTPPNSGPINNYAFTGTDINPVTYKGVRASVRWKVNEDWNALLTQSYQQLDADGVFWEEEYDGLGQKLPDLSVQLFNPNYNLDKFEDTQLTIEGRLAALKVIYAGGYLVRKVSEKQDYTNYSRGAYAGYYECMYPGYPFHYDAGTRAVVPTPGSAGFCYSPSEFWVDHQRSTHQTHELRVSTPDDWRMRAIGGLFWERYSIEEQANWFYGTAPIFVPVAPPPGATSNDPGVRPPGNTFFDDITRGYTQKALFGSLDLDLLPHRLTLTLGTRYFRFSNYEVGSFVGSFGCEIYGPATGAVPALPCTVPASYGQNLNSENLNKTDSGFRSRANLTWHVADDLMLYYTWSQGFRPGGFNRAAAFIQTSSPLYGIFSPPLSYAPDTLTNSEIGWKSEWLGRHLQVNGAVYQEDWKRTQIYVFDPGVTGGLAFTTNGPDYRVRGVELAVIARPLPGLTVTASGAWNSSEVVRTLSLVNPKTGQPIDILNPFGAVGSPLAQSPPFMGNLRVRYEIPVADYLLFAQVGVNRQGGSYATTDRITKTLQGVPVAFYDPGFTTYDASAGIGRGAWNAQLYAENLSDTRGILFSSYTEWVKSNTVNRPRTIGVRIGYTFTEHH